MKSAGAINARNSTSKAHASYLGTVIAPAFILRYESERKEYVKEDQFLRPIKIRLAIKETIRVDGPTCKHETTSTCGVQKVF